MESQCDDEFSPKIGSNHQAEIPFNLAHSEDVYDIPFSSAISPAVSATWSDADAECLVLALILFGKNFTHINKFLENKGLEEILSFYYGKFYKSDGYRRWSECKKLKGRKCMIAKKLSTKMRQNDLLSRLIPRVSKESQHTLLEVSKSYVEGKTCLEEYISSMKSIVGLDIFAEALGIGKENGVLNKFDLEPRKNSCGNISTSACKALSSLGPGNMIQSLKGGLRLSKTRSNELFWEAVWPHLLARGWHSEQPKNQDYLVFLIPGVKKFSRRKHLKGKHYFDSVKDVLSKVVAEPNIIVLEEEVEEGGSNEDDFSDNHRQCYLKPRFSNYNKDHTSFVNGGKPSDLRELKYVSSNTVEVNVDGKRYKGYKYTRRVSHSKDMSESIKHRSSKLTAIDTNRLHERKLLKVKQKRYSSIELEDASMMTTCLLKENKFGISTDNSPRMVKAKTLIYDRKKTDISDSWRVRLGDSNHVPSERRRLTVCAKVENSRIIENSSGGLGSDKVGFFCCSSSFLDGNQNVCDPVIHQQNGSSIATPYDRSVACVEVKKFESFSIPMIPSNSENSKTMAMKPLKRQSTRNSKLTVKAFQSLANEFLHVQKRQKKNDIRADKNIYNPFRKARTKGKTRPSRNILVHWNAVLVQEENMLNVDGSILS